MLALCGNNDMVIFLFYFLSMISGSMDVFVLYKIVTEDRRVQINYRGKLFWTCQEISVTRSLRHPPGSLLKIISLILSADISTK